MTQYFPPTYSQQLSITPLLPTMASNSVFIIPTTGNKPVPLLPLPLVGGGQVGYMSATG